MLLLGFVDADASTLRRVLSAPGRAVMLAIGGAEEALLARPGFNDLVLNKRSALRCGPHCRSNRHSFRAFCLCNVIILV